VEGEKRRTSLDADAAADSDVKDVKSLTASAVSVRSKPRDGWSPDEHRQGTVSLRTYAAYVKAAGGVIAVMAVLVTSVVAEGAKAFSFWWLAYWLNQGNGTANVSVSQSRNF